MIRVSIAGKLGNEPVRYLLAGGVNTIFGYSSFALLYFLFSHFVHYLVILVACTVVAVTFSYLTYKFFVFRTRSNYLREYARFYVVYAVPIALGFVLFPICIELLHLNPYLTQACIMVVTVVISYFGHKHVSFKVPMVSSERPAMTHRRERSS